MNEPIDLPPAPATKKYTLVDYAFQFITITAGVLIALLVNGLVQWNADRELVAQARETIALEIAANKKDLDATLAAVPGEIQRYDSAITFANNMLAKQKTTVSGLQLDLNLADLSSTGWRTAERTGALGHMPYDEVQKYSKLYDLQDLVVEQQRGMLDQLSAAMSILTADFNPDQPVMKDVEAFRDRVMLLRAALGIQEQMGQRLAESYAQALAPGTRP